MAGDVDTSRSSQVVSERRVLVSDFIIIVSSTSVIRPLLSLHTTPDDTVQSQLPNHHATSHLLSDIVATFDHP